MQCFSLFFEYIIDNKCFMDIILNGNNCGWKIEDCAYLDLKYLLPMYYEKTKCEQVPNEYIIKFFCNIIKNRMQHLFVHLTHCYIF